MTLSPRLEEERHTAAEVLKDESEQLRSEVYKTKQEGENIAALLDKKTRKYGYSAQINLCPRITSFIRLKLNKTTDDR